MDHHKTGGRAVSSATLSASKTPAGQGLTYAVQLKNNSEFSLYGNSGVVISPDRVSFAGTVGDSVIVQGDEVIITLRRLATGEETTFSIPTLVNPGTRGLVQGTVSSLAALQVVTNAVTTVMQH